jgi:hypothetical protein
VYEHAAPLQPTLVAFTLTRAVQSWSQAPQLCTSVGDEHAPDDPHVSWSLGQVQGPHWQLDVHVCAPLLPQVCVAPAVQAPPAVQALHADQTPFEHVRVSVPQRPQGWLDGPEHDWPSGDPVIIGCIAGVITDDQLPHSGSAWVLAAHAVVSTTFASAPTALVHVPAGSWICDPATVQSVPSSKTTQHALVPQTPPPPRGN